MINKYFFFPLLAALIFAPHLMVGQENPKLLKWFDAQIGMENSRLLNGTAYNEPYRITTPKNNLFNGTTGKGSVLYDGYWFTDLQMRYNIFDDALIVQLDSRDGIKIVELVREKVERFTLHGSTFTNFLPGISSGGIKGFHEILLEQGSISLFKKHAQSIIAKRDKQVLYYEFEPIEGHYAFNYNNDIYLIGSRNDLEKIFPQYSKEIRSYYRDNRSALRSRPDNFYTTLFRDLGRLEIEKRKL